MAITTTVTPTLQMSYTTTDVQSNRSVSESATIGFISQEFSNYISGTGYNEVNAGVIFTGVLGSG